MLWALAGPSSEGDPELPSAVTPRPVCPWRVQMGATDKWGYEKQVLAPPMETGNRGMIRGSQGE